MNKNWPNFDQGMVLAGDFFSKRTKQADWDQIYKAYYNYCDKPYCDDPESHNIPHTIHQIWIGGDMPETEAGMVDTVREWCSNNNWEHKLWTDSDVESLGDFNNKHLYDLTPNLGQKSDILRIEILHRYGGVYLDTDFVMIDYGNLDQLCDLNFFCCLCYDGWPSMANGVMGTAPAGATISLMRNFKDPILWGDAMEVIDTTGPYHTSRCVMETLGDDVVVLPNTFFYPYPNFTRDRIYGTNPSLYIKPETIAIHMWRSSWM